MKRQIRINRRIHPVGLVILIFLLILLLSALWFIRRHTFSVIKWKSHPETRNLIVADLLRKYPLEGMKEADVITLLGEEDEKGRLQTTFKGDRTYYPPESTLIYYLGQDLLEGRWLIISLNNGIVEKVSIGIT